MNLGKYLDQAAKRHGERPLFRFYDETISYVAFARRVNRLAGALRGLGVAKGDFVHVLVQNSPDVLAAYFAIQKIGAVAGPINNLWKAPEVEYLLNDSQGRTLIIEDQFLPILDEIRGRCPALETIIQIGGETREGHCAFATLIADGSDAVVECDAAADDLAYIFYTSGTTGNPKGVLLSHGNVLADVDGISEALALDPAMTILIFLPLFHVNAMLTCMFSVGLGFTIVLRKGFSASEFWQVVDRYKVNFWSAVPAVYQILLSDPGRQQYDLSSLQFGICGAAPLTAETMNRFEQTFGIPIVEGYGLTEATCVSTINPRDGVRKVGSIGLPIPGQEVAILDEQGAECPVGQRGEICIRGAVVMQGYYNRPQATQETIDAAGWMHTGDVAFRDEDGYIFIVDRIKDMVIRGGENIYPKEIDNLLATHPKIAEAATIGVPDETMGEEVKAFVVASDDSLTEQEVIDFCTEHLAAFKVPRYVEILEQDFPRNAVGKVLKKVLKQWGTTPRPKAPKTQASAADIFGTMEARVNPAGVKGLSANYGYVLGGDGGGEWTVCVANDAVKVKTGIHAPHVTTTISAADFVAITLGKLDGMTAFSSGRMKVAGDMSLLMKAPKLFKKYVPPQPAPQASAADIFGTMEARVNPAGVKGLSANYGYVLSGDGGGEWTVCVANDAVKVKTGIHDPHVTTTISAKDFVAITLGKLDGMTAFSSGRMKVAGDMSLLMKAPKLFKKYVPPQADGAAPQQELIVLKQLLSIPQRFTTGPLMGKFLKELRDNRRILGNRCPKCQRIQTPPREVCAICHVAAEELVEIGPEGEIVSFDVTYYASPDPLTGETRETPYCPAFFTLDGCGRADIFWHEVNPAHISKVRLGARVRPVWAERRSGSITDIKYFDIID